MKTCGGANIYINEEGNDIGENDDLIEYVDKWADRNAMHRAIESQKVIISNLTYSLDRYQEEFSPMCLYIPNTPLMFKMMKACIGVERV